MGVSVKTFERNNIKVELRFDPKIGPGTIRDYHKTSNRCREISRLLSPVNLSINFSNPYTYSGSGRSVNIFVFERDEKVWLPKKKREKLVKILKSKKAKKLGIVSFKIQRVKETITTRRELTLL